MMQDESPEFKVRSTIAKKLDLSASASLYSNDSEGPDDEFRPVKISVISSAQETRDEGDAFETEKLKNANMGGNDERAADEENGREEAEVTEMRDDNLEQEIEVTYSSGTNDEQTVISALGKSQDQDNNTTSSSELMEPEGEKSDESIIKIDISPRRTGVALFDTSLLDAESEGGTTKGDELSVVSKSVVDESSKNVEEAEALAKEMKRQLAKSLAEFSISPKAPIADDLDAEIEEKVGSKDSLGEKENELPSSESSVSSYYSKTEVLKLVKPVDSEVEGNHRIELPMVDTPLDAVSVSSSSSSKASVGHRRPRSSFRHRRPSTSSWANATEEAADSASPKAVQFLSSLPITKQQQQILENVVIPAVFLLGAVAICRTFFHPWLKVGNGQSNTWALTWTVLCIIAVVAPVCALEYMLLGGLLAGTALQEALSKYPEVKQFLKDVRRMRLKAGWWYPSEVRVLRKDLEATNDDLLLQQEEFMRSQKLHSEEDADARSIQRQMSREEHRREKSQLENVFESERKEWFTVKEQLMTEASSANDKSTKLEHQLEAEQQKQKQLTTQKEQLENNIEVERTQWKFTRVSLEEALKTAVAAQEDNEKTKEFFSKMEFARNEERYLWEKERQGFQATIKQSEEDARLVQQEHASKLRLFDEMALTKQSKWDDERKSLNELVQSANIEAKTVKDTLESQICQLKDANDDKNNSDMRAMKLSFLKEQKALKEVIEEAKKEQHVSLQCVSNMQSVMEEERAELELTRATLKQTETILQEERGAWEDARKTLEEALALATTAKSDQDIVLRQELSKIKALEVSIQQLENIVSIQETIEINSSKQKDGGKANRKAEDSPVDFVIPQQDEAESVNTTPSIDVSNASTYYSWVEKVQETHGKEQRKLLKGLLTQHIRWQAANHHVRQLLDSSLGLLEASQTLEASETLESSETFQECLLKHTATSVSAKKYMDDLAVKQTPELPRSLMAAVAEGIAKGTKDSEATTTAEEKPIRSIIRLRNQWTNNTKALSWEQILEKTGPILRLRNPWSKNALPWEQLWAKNALLWEQILEKTGCPQTVAKTICSGMVVGAGVGLGLFHLRSMKQHNKLSR